jgi:imidazolonepropionase-like amidohydrolase
MIFKNYSKSAFKAPLLKISAKVRCMMVLIKNALVAGLGEEKQDILLSEGKIQKIGKNIDCTGCNEVIDA